jgi:hypothetical protein
MSDEPTTALPPPLALLLGLALPGAWATTTAANDVDEQPASTVPGSRALRSMAYDAATRTLRIEWSSGNAYELFDVPPHLHEGLAAAPSKGRYFQDHLRDRFVHKRLR